MNLQNICLDKSQVIGIGLLPIPRNIEIGMMAWTKGVEVVRVWKEAWAGWLSEGEISPSGTRVKEGFSKETMMRLAPWR